MSRSKNKPTAGASPSRRSAAPVISLAKARKMLPLVSGIVEDIRSRWNRLTELEAEQLDLDHRRRDLTWPERSRRYQIADEIALEQKGIQEAIGELDQLQVILADAVLGEAAFPTIINGRRAYYLWKAGEKDIAFWCYATDPTRRPIPTDQEPG